MRPPGALAAVVRALGGELYDGGRAALVPGPGHSPADRSLSLRLAEDGRLLIHSFAGDDWRSVRDHLARIGLVDSAGRPPGDDRVEAPRPHAPERVAAAGALWAESRPLPQTLGEVHLRKRAVRRPSPAELRFHPAVPAAVYAARGPRRPALIAGIRDVDGVLTGVEVTYLGADGGPAPLRIPRKTIGLRPPGAAVRLDAPAPVLLVGEGVFSCLSASDLLDLPAWALLSVANLRRWSPPAGVRRVVIAADADPPGLAGARALAARLGRAGVAAVVRGPPAGFADWNDAARAAAAREAEGRR